MGVKNIDIIAAQLIHHGVSIEKPAAVIFNGTLPEEEIITGTLQSIAGRIRKHPTDAPGLVIVGDAVKTLESRSDSWMSTTEVFQKAWELI
jgi:siroheme synthase